MATLDRLYCIQTFCINLFYVRQAQSLDVDDDENQGLF